MIAGASSALFFKESAMLIAGLFGAIQRYLRYRSVLLNIENLDDRILNDIGLSRGELSAAAWDRVERAMAH
jgi:uncharacterized protein YjiS (DUF1127 family)